MADYYNQNNILLKNSVLTDHLPVGTVFSTDPALKSGLTGVWKKTRQDSSAGTYREVSFEKAASVGVSASRCPCKSDGSGRNSSI